MEFRLLRSFLSVLPGAKAIFSPRGPFSSRLEAETAVAAAAAVERKLILLAVVLNEAHFSLVAWVPSSSHPNRLVYYDSADFQSGNTCGAHVILFAVSLVAGSRAAAAAGGEKEGGKWRKANDENFDFLALDALSELFAAAG